MEKIPKPPDGFVHVKGRVPKEGEKHYYWFDLENHWIFMNGESESRLAGPCEDGLDSTRTLAFAAATVKPKPKKKPAAKPKRKIVQLLPETDKQWMIALCDDGTVWFLENDKEWTPFARTDETLILIPQT